MTTDYLKSLSDACGDIEKLLGKSPSTPSTTKSLQQRRKELQDDIDKKQAEIRVIDKQMLDEYNKQACERRKKEIELMDKTRMYQLRMTGILFEMEEQCWKQKNTLFNSYKIV
jgi:hypothetical protein